MATETCQGITAAGNRCKKLPKKGDGETYCHLHLGQKGVQPSSLQSLPTPPPSSFQETCHGITAAGNPCKKFPKKGSGEMYCHLHLDQKGVRPSSLQPSSLQIPCHGITAAGNRCKNLLKRGSPEEYCHLHRDQRSFRPPSLQIPPPPGFDLTKHLLYTIQGLDSAIKTFGSSRLQSISSNYLEGMKIAKIADTLFPEPVTHKVPPSVVSEITEPENHGTPIFI